MNILRKEKICLVLEEKIKLGGERERKEFSVSIKQNIQKKLFVFFTKKELSDEKIINLLGKKEDLKQKGTGILEITPERKEPWMSNRKKILNLPQIWVLKTKPLFVFTEEEELLLAITIGRPMKINYTCYYPKVLLNRQTQTIPLIQFRSRCVEEKLILF